jgi:hypothetical protein
MSSSEDGGRPDIDLSADVLSSDDPPARSRWLGSGTARVVLALVVGAVGGYLLGVRTNAPAPAPTPKVDVVTEAVGDAGTRCWTQVGSALELGAGVANRSSTAVILTGVVADLPLGGLTPLWSMWAPCGQPHPAGDPVDLTLAPGATAWVTMTFQVDQVCPAPLPVLFTVDYIREGVERLASIPAFSDLGDVGYSRCETSTPTQIRGFG